MPDSERDTVDIICQSHMTPKYAQVRQELWLLLVQ